MTTLHIKNMVCPRCVAAVKQMLTEHGCQSPEVRLGEAVLAETLDDSQMQLVRKSLRALGFDLLEDKQTVLVESIRRGVISWVRTEGNRMRLSDYLQQKLLKDYSTLSKLFSEVRGMTIERYCVTLRIEYAKELLSYDQKNINEIADMLGYSSPAHFSSQFKQETGMSPSQFKKDHMRAERCPLDSL